MVISLSSSSFKALTKLSTDITIVFNTELTDYNQSFNFVTKHMNSYQRSSSEKTPLSSGIVLTSYSPVNATEQIDQNNLGSSLPERETAKTHWTNLAYFALVFALLLFAAYKLSMPNEIKDMPIQKGAWSSQAAPFSTVNPADLNISVVDRPKSSSPGPIFAGIDSTIPLPTNGWYENLFLGPPNNTLLENNVFQVPYILDTAGYIQGVRTHAAHVQANDRTVMVSCWSARRVSAANISTHCACAICR